MILLWMVVDRLECFDGCGVWLWVVLIFFWVFLYCLKRVVSGCVSL